MKKIAFWSALIFGVPSVCFAQDKVEKNKIAEKYANTITADDLSKHLHVIAADSMEGRDTGKEGQKKAARYISAHFKNIGLLAPVKTENGMSYLQEFQMVNRSWGEVSMKVAGENIVYLENMFAVGDINMDKELELNSILLAVPVGLYKNYDVKDKAVFIYENNEGGKSNLFTSSEELYKNGAKVVIVIASDFKKTLDYNGIYVKKAEYNKLINPKASRNNVFVVSMPVAEKVFKTTSSELMTEKEKNSKLTGNQMAESRSGQKITLKAQKNIKVSLASENILGFVEGTDKKDEILVISAHYDHVGMANGEVYNGADDDGSGTVTVMELAEAFSKAAQDGNRPRRSILFITVAGEEKGLFGSEFYADVNPIFPLENTVADLNIDMVGRLGGEYENSNNPNYIYLIGSDKLSTDLHKLSESMNATYTQLKLDYKYNSDSDPNRFYYRSDHYNFAKNNIPVIFYFNGTHVDYHQATDEVSKILFPKMEKIARLVFYTAWEIANREERLKVDKK